MSASPRIAHTAGRPRPSPRARRVAVAAAVLGALFTGCRTHRQQEPAAEASAGAIHYAHYCAACHLPDGAGVPGGAPPLAGSPWVTGPQERLTRIVLHGLRGPLDVAGTTYNLEMLGFGPILTDQQIAALLTYVRARFGPDSPAITAADVAEVRAAAQDRTEYWTVEELLAVP